MKQPANPTNRKVASSTPMNTPVNGRWTLPTRWLHALIALGISAQLILSLVMANPHRLQNASAFQKTTLEAHEVVGLITLFFMIIHWLWILNIRSDVSIKSLFPWFGKPFQHLKGDLLLLIREKRFPAVGEHGGLSGFIHGLGFLGATVMVVSGFGLYASLEWGAGVDSSLFHQVGNIHGFFGNLMWAYLAGHVIAATWHEYKGEHIIASMFRLIGR